jgi:hypothetical protein
VWYRDSVPLYDTFEPEYIRCAFTDKELNLGSLIFGEDEWKALQEADRQAAQDPLTAVFAERSMSSFSVQHFTWLIVYLDLLNSKTYLRPQHYTTLLPTDDRKARTHRPTYAWTIPKKQVWSVTKSFPANSEAKENKQRKSNSKS